MLEIVPTFWYYFTKSVSACVCVYVCTCICCVWLVGGQSLSEVQHTAPLPKNAVLFQHRLTGHFTRPSTSMQMANQLIARQHLSIQHSGALL